MEIPQVLFCVGCGDVKEQKCFRKCEECDKFQEADEPKGAYNCNFHDSEEFYLKGKKIICYDCNNKKNGEPELNELEINVNDNKDDLFQKTLENKIQQLRDSCKYIAEQLVNNNKELIRYNLENDVTRAALKIGTALNLTDKDYGSVLIYPPCMFDDYNEKIKRNDRLIKEHYVMIDLYERALAVHKQEREMSIHHA